MIKRFSCVLGAMLLVAFASVSQAATVFQNPAGNVYLIRGLLFQGDYYNVTFAFGSFNDAYGGRDNPFPGGLSDGAEALAEILNSAGAQSVGPDGGPGGIFVFVPGFPVGSEFEDSIGGGQLFFEDVCGLGVWCHPAPFSWPADDDQHGYVWAVFERVPEPGSLALLAIGLGALASRRRQVHLS